VILMGRALGSQGAVFEATYRADTAGEVVLIEGHLLGRAEATGKTAVGMQTQGPVLGDREEPLAAVADLVEVQVATRDGGLQAQALGIAAIREDTAVQRRLRPTEVGFEVHEAIAFGIEELLDLTRRIQAFLDIVLLQRHAE